MFKYKKIIFLLFILFISACSSSKQEEDNQINNKKETNLIRRKEIVSKFLENYKFVFESKKTDDIIKLYSLKHSAALDSKDALNELFLASDKITILFSDVKIISEPENNNVIFETKVTQNIFLNDKQISDVQLVQYTLSKESENFFLQDKKIIKIF